MDVNTKMKNVNIFCITANEGLLCELFLKVKNDMFCSLQKISQGRLMLEAYEQLDFDIVCAIIRLGMKHPNEEIHFTYSSSRYDYGKKEYYKVNNSVAMMCDVEWDEGVDYDRSGRKYELMEMCRARLHFNKVISELRTSSS